MPYEEQRQHWWGFRIKLPPGYDPEPPSRLEYAVIWLTISLVVQLGWILWLQFGPTPPAGWWSVLERGFLVPSAIAIAAVLLGLFLPKIVQRSLHLDALVIFARENHGLGTLDSVGVVVSIVLLVLAVFHATSVLWWPHIAFIVSALLAFIGQRFFLAPADMVHSRYDFTLPDWLAKADDGPVQPEPQANVLFDFELPAEGAVRKVPLGIYLSDDILDATRRVNIDGEGKRGALFRDNPNAAVLLKPPPVSGIGATELTQLTRQMASAIQTAGLSRFQAANAALAFVQLAIKYAHDKDSTHNIEGGPYSEYGRLALETLHDRVGDCECTSILCASILAYLGYTVGFLHIKYTDTATGNETHHLAVGLDADEALEIADLSDLSVYVHASPSRTIRYLYGETAIDGGTAGFGMCIQEYGKAVDVYRVEVIGELDKGQS